MWPQMAGTRSIECMSLINKAQGIKRYDFQLKELHLAKKFKKFLALLMRGLRDVVGLIDIYCK